MNCEDSGEWGDGGGSWSIVCATENNQGGYDKGRAFKRQGRNYQGK